MIWHRRQQIQRDKEVVDANHEADCRMQEERERLDEAREVAAKLREWRRQNHFVEMITESIRRAQ